MEAPQRSWLSYLLGGRESKRSIEHSAFVVNGWQSFSFAGSLHGAQNQPRPSIEYLSGAFHTGAEPPAAHNGDAAALSSDMYGLLRFKRPACADRHGVLFAGFVSQRHTFGGVLAPAAGSLPKMLLFAEADLPFHAPDEDVIETDWAFVQLSISTTEAQISQQADELEANTQAAAALQRYVELIAVHLAVKPRSPPK
eukprot:2462770-Amphidinium_carterae.1